MLVDLTSFTKYKTQRHCFSFVYSVKVVVNNWMNLERWTVKAVNQMFFFAIGINKWSKPKPFGSFFVDDLPKNGPKSRPNVDSEIFSVVAMLDAC